MYLESKKQGASQRCLDARYGVSQSTVSRCIDRTEGVLEEFAATADNINDRMEKARTVAKMQSALAELIEGVLYLAGAPWSSPRRCPRRCRTTG